MRNVERLRDFIKHVYVDRIYSGERSLDKPPRAKTKVLEVHHTMNERRYSDRPSPGGRSDGSSRNSYDERRSPGYDQDFKKSTSLTDVVNDWRREDRFGNGRRYDDGGSKVEGRSPDRQSNPDMSSPPIVRHVREILGNSVSPLQGLIAKQERMKTTQEAHIEKLDHVAKSQSSLEDDLKLIQGYYDIKFNKVEHSGIHREFTHRVKSVSMAKFTSQEVSALQGGGNASAKEIYFKEWDAQRHSFPDSSPGRRSDESSRNSYDERRSPGYDQDFKKSPARTDVVNDWRREDRFGNGRRSDDGGFKVEGRSPDRQSNPDMSSPPIVRPIREILGDSVSPLRGLIGATQKVLDLLQCRQPTV
nr:probable ADP-ribosylation factor GTPase-activating protein AGD14 isoform X2 [Tanacetum cinerariifolium]